VFAGTPGALGSGLASLIVLGLFTVGQLLVLYAARLNPDYALGASMLSFVLKIAVLGVLLLTLGRSEFMNELNSMAFALTALACVMVWLMAQARGLAKARIPTVEPESGESR
jgi:ATP synthase protein I